MFALCADAERADNVIAAANGDAERAAHAGLLGGGLSHAGGVRLQVTDGHGTILLRALTGDAFADGDDAHHIQQLRRQPDLHNEAQKLGWRVEFVNGAGFGIKLGERVAQDFF